MNILITGGSGMVGKRLRNKLQEAGHDVRILSRNPKGRAHYYAWSLEKREVDPEALLNLDTIIHLAGSGVAEGRWTKKRKAEIFESRIETAQLLYAKLEENKQQISKFITASGVGYYGPFPQGAVDESTGAGSGFLSEVCEKWEEAGQQFKDHGADIFVCRIGIVLAREGGFIGKLEPLIKRGLGSKLGKASQMTSWIHIDELVNGIFQMVSGNIKAGIYNMVSPGAVSHSALMDTLAAKLNRKIWAPNAPEFILKLVFGELTDELLANQKVIPKALVDEGYKFRFPTIQTALDDLYS